MDGSQVEKGRLEVIIILKSLQASERRRSDVAEGSVAQADQPIGGRDGDLDRVRSSVSVLALPVASIGPVVV